MLTGVNAGGHCRSWRAPAGLRVIASGGVASLEDMRAARAAEAEGIEGVIIGMALYRGAFTLHEALRIAAEGG